MLIQKICAECGGTFETRPNTGAVYCSELHQKKAYNRKRWADPEYRALQLSRQRARTKRLREGEAKQRLEMGPWEKQLIKDCYDAGWGGTATMHLIKELLGITRSNKVIRSFCVREYELDNPSTAASERLPDYRGCDDNFRAAMRSAHPEIKEGIFRDNSPLRVKPISRPGIYGGSVAADVAELGSPRGSKW